MNATKSQNYSRANWYKRLFAKMMADSSQQYDKLVMQRKHTLLGNLRGTVLEIGPGTGPNLAYYAPDIQWIGVEPNTAMYSYIEQEARRLGLPIDLREGDSEHLPVADNSMDAVVSTLVLCSVRDLSGTLQEILRVLKPGGQFIFIEHVAAPRDTGRRWRQRLIRPAWRIMADGCQTDRETWTFIENAGFKQVQLEHFVLAVPIIGPHIAGVAVK